MTPCIAEAGAAINEERRISKEAVRIIHLKANDEKGGVGIKSLAKLVNAGIYLAGLRSRDDMGKTMRLPHNQLVKQYIVEHESATIQTMLDRVHNIVTVDFEVAVAHATPTTATKFLTGRAPC